MKYLTGTLGLIMLAAAICAVSAQDRAPVLDTAGQPLRPGVDYVIRPALTGAGGPFTLVDRNDSCPLFVGQRNITADLIPVTFAPFDEAESVVFESRNLKVTFSAVSVCVMSTAWNAASEAESGGRRLIAAAEDGGRGGLGNYFKIRGGVEGRFYEMYWCPSELCPNCRLRCGSVGSLVENGQLLAALDGDALHVEFVRA